MAITSCGCIRMLLAFSSLDFLCQMTSDLSANAETFPRAKCQEAYAHEDAFSWLADSTCGTIEIRCMNNARPTILIPYKCSAWIECVEKPEWVRARSPNPTSNVFFCLGYRCSASVFSPLLIFGSNLNSNAHTVFRAHSHLFYCEERVKVNFYYLFGITCEHNVHFVLFIC